MPLQMSFEDYKKRVQNCLEATISKERVSKMMAFYEEELLECYNENWSPAGVAAGVASGLL